MDVECGLMVWNIPRQVNHFIWNKMLKLKNLKQFAIMMYRLKTLIVI
jgi:hypothetical protein